MNEPRGSANLYATVNFIENENKVKSNRIKINFAQGYSSLVKEIEYAARQCPTDEGFIAEKITISFGEESFALTPDFNKDNLVGKLLLPNKDKLKITIEVVGSTAKPKGPVQRNNSRASIAPLRNARASTMPRARTQSDNSKTTEIAATLEEPAVKCEEPILVQEIAPVAVAAPVAVKPLEGAAPAIETTVAKVVVKKEVKKIEDRAARKEKALKAAINKTWVSVDETGEKVVENSVAEDSDCEETATTEPAAEVDRESTSESLEQVAVSLDFEAVAVPAVAVEEPVAAPHTPLAGPIAVAETVEAAPAVALDTLRTPEPAKLRSTKGTASNTGRAKSANRTRMPTQQTETPGKATIYNSSGSTAGEVALILQNQLRHTTGSAALAQATAAAASMSMNATISSTPSVPRSAVKNTPAKKAKSGNTTTHELSPLSAMMAMPSANKGKKNIEGRPSIGTMGDQWEFMRSSFFNNNDEEIVWAMVSRKGGAYHHAHKKNQAAEDRYFQCMYDISMLDSKIESLTSGPAARTVAMVMQLKDLCGDFQAVPSAETIAKVDDVLGKMKSLVASTTAEGESVLKVFSTPTEAAIESILSTEDHGTLLRAARKQSGNFSCEQLNLRNQLKKANKDSDEALENMEKWARRERDANDYASTIRREEEEWLEAQLMLNAQALTTMRSYIPVNVTELSIADIQAKAKAEGGLFSLELATEIKQNKLLHWLVTHEDDIVMDSFLIGDKKSFFENFDQLDVVEMRALVNILPVKFENDKDGKKAEWRSRFFAKVKQLVSQEQRDLVKGCFDPSLGKRQMVPQPELKLEQQRRAVYFYQTKEKSAQRVKQYNDRVALLARREGVLANAETAAAAAKEEYDIVLKEMRDPDFIAEYGVEVLARSKDAAKDNLTRANSALKSANSDLANLLKTIREMPMSREQYLEAEAEIVAFILKTRRIDWAAPKLAAVEIEGVFDPTVEIKKVEKASSKFVSAEEEAALRKQEMEQLLSRKPFQSQLTGDDESRAVSPDTIDAGSEGSADATVPATPLAAANNTQTAPNTEFRRLSVAQTGMFSPVAGRKSELTGTADANGTDMFTPRKRNSVLLNANPEMLNTLNKMLAASSPAPTPNKRQSLFPMASATKPSAGGEAQNEENKKPTKKVQTRSTFVKQMLNPGGAVSPKRNPLGDLSAAAGPAGAAGGPPKLNFLAQLTARVKSASVDAGNPGNMAAEVTKSITTTAKSLFADIARFRKSEDEVAVVGSGSAEDKENSARSNTVAPAAGSTEVVHKAPIMSGLGGMGGVGGMGGMPRMAMSMFDEIRKRRVIE